MAIARPPSSPESREDDAPAPAWHVQDVESVVSALESDSTGGLSSAAIDDRRTRFGDNVIAAEPAPSVAALVLLQLKDPMNLMLIAVVIVSLVIAEVSTALVVAALVVLNLVLGTRQELKARASVDALARIQVPQARVVRGGVLVEVPAAQLVPGDIVQLEAGDLVPADGRLVRAATLETQEAALTGERADPEGPRRAHRCRAGPG